MKSPILRVLKEISIPEYRARHLFTAKLRLAIFLGFWFLYVIILKDSLSETKPVTIAILASFLLTTIGYYNILNNRFLVTSFFIEILADITTVTAIVYLTGGPFSEYYILYVFYALLAGLFYNYRLAFLVSVFSFIIYGLFLTLCYWGWIPLILVGVGGHTHLPREMPYLHPIFMIIFSALAIYATKIAHYFTQIRERMLEAKNKELLALQQMSSTIRTVVSLDNVLVQVLNGVLEGLELKMCILMLNENDENRIKCIPPEGNPLLPEIEKILGVNLNDLYIPYESIENNAALKQVTQGRIIFRREIGEIISGVKPDLDIEKLNELQNFLDIKRVVAIPLITSREVIGSLIGFTSEAFVEAKMVNTFQAFADQASLTIEAALLISELKKKNIELIEANRVKSEFLATMSHELRTPLTAIIGFSELLLEGVMGSLSEEQIDSLKEVLGNGNNLLEMINNLLDLAKVDSGKMELARHTFSWDEMIRRVERSVAPLIKKKGHKLEVDIPKDMPVVFADEKRMQQIILNLLSNAIKFTPKNGELNIKSIFFKSLEDFEGEFSHREEFVQRDVFQKGLLACTVKDNGIGIAEEDLPGIFDVFQQVDSSVTRSYEGTGLGLALVKQFVGLHNGFVWVESKENVGTEFSFVIPVE